MVQPKQARFRLTFQLWVQALRLSGELDYYLGPGTPLRELLLLKVNDFELELWIVLAFAYGVP